MKKTCFSIFVFTMLSLITNGQYCTSNSRFTEQDYFQSTQIKSDLDKNYASAKNKSGVTQDLYLDVFYPADEHDDLNKRPFILLIHGGGFIQGQKSDFHYEAQQFAKKGFVTASMQYRLGDASDNVLEQTLRIYRAIQDAHAAMRWMVEHAPDYQVDTSWMFIGGVSAGSVTAHDLIYTQQSDWDLLVPSAKTILGALDTSGNNLTHSFSLKALYNNCGSTTGSAVKASEMVPTIAFHKTYDHIVTPDTSLGGSFGSRAMHNWLGDEGVCTELTLDTNYYDPLVDGHCPFFDLSGFKMRVDRATCFFKSVICSSCESASMIGIEARSCTSTLSTKNPVNELTLYPNPAVEVITIKNSAPIIKVMIINPLGQASVMLVSNNEIDVSNLPSGVYVLVLETSEGIENVRIIKE